MKKVVNTKRLIHAFVLSGSLNMAKNINLRSLIVNLRTERLSSTFLIRKLEIVFRNYYPLSCISSGYGLTYKINNKEEVFMGLLMKKMLFM